MLKIKFFAVAVVLSLAAILSAIPPSFVSKAESDVILQQIAGYKTWQRVNKEPIKVPLVDHKTGDGNSFIIDGKEIKLDLGGG